MKSESFNTKPLLGLLLAAAALLLQPMLASAGKAPVAVYFGDSLSDTGNRFFDDGIVNTPPYDVVAAEDLIPSAPYAVGGHTFTNGPVWLEHLAKWLDRQGAGQAALRSHGIASNYAYGGARASNAYPLPPNSNRHLTDQVMQYLADVNMGVSAETLHVMFIGGNDVGEAMRLYVSDPTNGPLLAQLAIQNAVQSIAGNALALRSAGAARFFFVAAPNVGYVPAFAPFGPAAVQLGAGLATGFNCALYGTSESRPLCPLGPVLVDVLRASGASVVVLDGQQVFDELVSNAADFGLSNVSSPCIRPFEPPFRCRKPGEYMFWDNFHPTARVHELIGQAAIDSLSP